jgi:ferritin-like metal-binding protein YciE
MKSESLQELYLEQLRDAFDAEQQLLKGLSKMAKAATNDELQAAFEQHLEPKGHKCEAMKGLLLEAENIIEELEDDTDTLDAALICAAQKVEHYEIATYGCLRTYAEILGYDEHADMLQDTLDEEKDTDDNLTELAVTCINLDAAEGDDAEEEEEDAEEEEIEDEDAEDVTAEDEDDEGLEEDEEKPRGRGR